MSKAAVFLLLLGLLQMAGDVLGLRALKGIGAATNASPAPKVFSTVSGLETYSSRFFLEWKDRAGGERSLQITPEIYARIRGPYNRRNVFGAVFAYGPVLPAALREPVMRYALCGPAPLLHELGIDPATVEAVRIRLEPLPGTGPRGLPLVLDAPCRGQ